jgi:hypothetical protein
VRSTLILLLASPTPAARHRRHRPDGLDRRPHHSCRLAAPPARRYMGLALLNKARLAIIDGGQHDDPTNSQPAPIAAKHQPGSPR